VVMRVPLDPCGNPIPSQAAQSQAAPAQAPQLQSGVQPAAMQSPVASSAASSTTAPAAAARPTIAPTPAPAAAAPDAAPMKTYSDRPAEPATRVEEGWKGSKLDHVDPAVAPKPSAAAGSQNDGAAQNGAVGQFRAEKPAAEAGSDLRSVETIPTPAARQPATGVQPGPSVAPLGPSVEPAPPASDPRNVPAAEISGRGPHADVSSGDRST